MLKGVPYMLKVRSDYTSVTSVTKLKYGHSAAQTPPEHYGTEWFLSCFQEGVELTPLRRGRDAPLDVPVHDGRLVHLDSTIRMYK